MSEWMDVNIIWSLNFQGKPSLRKNTHASQIALIDKGRRIWKKLHIKREARKGLLIPRAYEGKRYIQAEVERSTHTTIVAREHQERRMI